MRLHLSKSYLWIPVEKEGPEVKLHFYVNGDKVQEIDVRLGGTKGDFYTAIDVSCWLGRELEIRSSVPDMALNGIDSHDERPRNKYPFRPHLHFAPEIGWSNDPNGLVYDAGVYHLFYQWNPYGVIWGNMHWGHAVSRDLLHWEHREAAITPNEHGTAYSGCGWIDKKNTAKYGKNALLFYYTAAGGRNQWSLEKGNLFTQRMQISLDGGDTLQSRDDFLMEHVMGENRDPKVLYHRESGAYNMVLYLDENLFSVYRSGDLLHWVETQRLSLKGMRECPDLFELPVVNSENERKWVFWSADGFYAVGAFDGYTFTPETEVQEAYGTQLPYAAQTYAGVSDRVISVAWLRMQNDRGNYRGVMSLPAELYLVRQGTEYRIGFRPVKELEALRQPQGEWNLEGAESRTLRNEEGAGSGQSGMSRCREAGQDRNSVEDNWCRQIELRGEPVEIRISWSAQDSGQTKLSLGQSVIVMDFAGKKVYLYAGEKKTELCKGMIRNDGPLDLQFIIDQEVIEFYGCGGTAYGALETEEDVLHKKLKIESTAEILSMRWFELREDSMEE